MRHKLLEFSVNFHSLLKMPEETREPMFCLDEGSTSQNKRQPRTLNVSVVSIRLVPSVPFRPMVKPDLYFSIAATA